MARYSAGGGMLFSKVKTRCRIHREAILFNGAIVAIRRLFTRLAAHGGDTGSTGVTRMAIYLLHSLRLLDLPFLKFLGSRRQSLPG